jgi:hypothetical protein
VGLIEGFGAAVGASPLPPGSFGVARPDSAPFVRLPPGAHAVQVCGANNAAGIALAEACEAPWQAAR